MSQGDFQTRYFTDLTRRFDTKQAMIAWVADELNLSRDAIYRRVRGDSQLTANELSILAGGFDQPMPDGDHAIPFRYNRSERSIRRPEDYIEQLEVHLATVRQLSAPELFIANPGIPIFYEMLYPRLLSLKLFVYGNTCWDFAGWRELPFSAGLIDPKLLQRAREIAAVSLQLPGYDLWSMGMLNTTLDQIEYLHVAGRFAEDREAIILLDELQAMVDHMKEMARTGRKFLPGKTPTDTDAKFQPVHNELAHNDNAILVQSAQRSTLFVTFITPNFLQTEDEKTCRMIRAWFDRMASVSGSLGPKAGKYREWYFNRLAEQIAQTRRRVLAGGY